MAKPVVARMSLPLWVYIVGWLFFAYLFTQILSFGPFNANNILLSGMQFIDFGVHEASHLVFFFLPSVLVASAGSIGEIIFAGLILTATIKGKSYFATVFASLWVMLAFRSAGVYMADARTQAIPLIGPGETVKHDWNYVFGQLGLLHQDTIIGGTFITIGVAIGVVGLAFGLFLIVRKIAKQA
ncbi:MAG: hypothetical protein JWO99_339 [Candidatus Saccharibacteria bacterium]|nr:hypothetical protein [Candidatus Saccharibacteria bacterium]